MKQINTFKDYIEFTKTTAVYPKDKAIEYLALGMVDEFGEFVEKLEQGSVYKICDELSDVCWYVAQLCDILNTDLSNMRFSIDYVDSYLDTDSVEHCVYKMNSYMATICGCIKKVIRDENTDKIPIINEHLIHILNTLSKLSTQVGGYNLKNILEINVAKLSDRQDRGVLKGDGDNR